MPNFSTPLSGLTANSTALSAIANNLANLNTVGYQRTRAVFRDMFYQSLGSSGSGNPIQLGTGAAVSALNTVFGGGSVESSGVPTDVAIMGDGFFVLQDGQNYEFSRAGNFHVGPGGYLLSEDGRAVMGYPAVGGTVAAGQALGPLQLGGGQMSPPSATSSFELSANFDAREQVGGSFSTPITVYDSLGATHVLTLNFTKTAANTWSYDVAAPSSDLSVTPGTDGSGSAVPVPDTITLCSGTLSFDAAGKLQAINPPSTATAVPVTTVLAPDSTGMTVNGLADGAQNLSMNWNLFSDLGDGLLTQVSAPSSTSATHQDGLGAGMLTEFGIDSDGMIIGSFSNGKTTVLGQLALASFANSEGLSRAGDNNFSATLSSGVPVFGVPGTSGRGSVAGGSLELSNVDIAREFAQMITAQRGFQANARAITTFDEIAQETINLKR